MRQKKCNAVFLALAGAEDSQQRRQIAVPRNGSVTGLRMPPSWRGTKVDFKQQTDGILTMLQTAVLTDILPPIELVPQSGRPTTPSC